MDKNAEKKSSGKKDNADKKKGSAHGGAAAEKKAPHQQHQHQPKKDDKSMGEGFMHLVRVSGTVLDGNKDVSRALTDIHGIGPHIAKSLLKNLNFERGRKLGTLSDEEISGIESLLGSVDKKLPGWMLNRRKDIWVGKDRHLFGPDLDMINRDDINLQKRIRSYRGVRHASGLPVRGQRTRTSFRKGTTIGVVRKKMQPASKPATKGGGGASGGGGKK